MYINIYIIIRVRSAFSLVASCVLLKYTRAQLYYNIKQIDFIFLCFCTVIDHR